jgi:urea transport system permease protein
MLMVFLVPGMLALVLGFLCFGSRIMGVYLSIITQAMTYALMLAFFRNDMGLGGNNGFTDFKELPGMPLNTGAARAALFYASLVSLVGCYLLGRWITGTKYGHVLTAIRDAESRVRFLGYSVTQHKLFAFVLSAMMAGLTGALYVPQVGIINPGEFSPGNSIEAVVWVAVGGRGTLVGAVLGAFSVNGLKTWLTSAAPDLWLFVLGGLFVLVTLFLPRGLVGLAKGRTR